MNLMHLLKDPPIQIILTTFFTSFGYTVKSYIKVYRQLKVLDKGLEPDVIFDYVEYSFINGYKVVGLNGKYNLISRDNRLVSPNQWFDWCDDFINGYARIKLNNKMNWISLNNRLVSPEQWFDGVLEFNENGYSSAKIGNTWYKIDTNCQLYDYDTMEPISQPNNTNMTLNELKHIIKESIKRQIINL